MARRGPALVTAAAELAKGLLSAIEGSRRGQSGSSLARGRRCKGSTHPKARRTRVIGRAAQGRN